MMIRTYTELQRIDDFVQRYQYLSLRGTVGSSTFGHDRWMNQQFYTSRQWRNLRHHIIARDLGCDLAVEGYDIHDKVIIHHMNPVTADDIVHGDASILDPEFLITTTHQTHNAIHYGDERLLPRAPIVRRPGDTKLW